MVSVALQKMLSGSCVQIYHDEGEELQQVETEDVLALQAQSDLDDSDVSDLDSPSEMSDNE